MGAPTFWTIYCDQSGLAQDSAAGPSTLDELPNLLVLAMSSCGTAVER